MLMAHCQAPETLRSIAETFQNSYKDGTNRPTAEPYIQSDP